MEGGVASWEVSRARGVKRPTQEAKGRKRGKMGKEVLGGVEEE